MWKIPTFFPNNYYMQPGYAGYAYSFKHYF